MTAGDTYNIVGGLKGRRAVAFLGGATDDGIQIDSFADNGTGYAMIVKAA